MLVRRPAFSVLSTAVHIRSLPLRQRFKCSRHWIISSTSARAYSTVQNNVILSPSSSELPSVFDPGSSFSDLGMSPEICDKLRSAGIVHPTHVQTAAIPRLLAGLEVQLEYAQTVFEARQQYRSMNEPESALPTLLDTDFVPPEPPHDADDVLMIGAETGSGKTLAYLLPFIEALRRNPNANIKAVVLQPTRELCFQTSRFLEMHVPDTPRTLVLSGGRPPDVSDLPSVRIFIATPTSLRRHMRFSEDSLRNDKYIIVDEADMLLSRSFLDEIEFILDQPSMKPFATRRNRRVRAHNRNRLVFVGATYPHWVGERVKSIITWMRARYPNIRECTTANIHRRSERLESSWRHVKDEEDRLESLKEVLGSAKGEKVMVFTETAGRAQMLFEKLGNTYGLSARLHKNMTVPERAESLKQFSKDEVKILFCTDVASRGLDLGHVTRVVEFDFATNVVAHLHRIGRTARAGAAGRTDSFFDDVSKPLADAIRTRESRDENVVDGVFSRNRSFRRKLKKKLTDEVSDDNA